MSVVVITVAAVLAFAGVVLLGVPVMLRQATSLIETAPTMLEQARLFLSARFPELLPVNGDVGTALTDLGAAMGEQMGTLASRLLSSVGGIIMALIEKEYPELWRDMQQIRYQDKK